VRVPARGRTLLVGDVHGCADELAQLVRRASPTRTVLLGDLFTKGPDPAGVWALIEDQQMEAILGNHDAAVIERWGRWPLPDRALAWLERRPLTARGRGWVAVHAGLDPDRGVDGTRKRTALHVRRWPDDARPLKPFWFEQYRGPGLVVYGHDAQRGLVDRRPHTLGLDTGCVYGGALTGWIAEEDRLVQVPARRIYKDPLIKDPLIARR
jgi:serine/threonine protein phosphatase 1